MKTPTSLRGFAELLESKYQEECKIILADADYWLEELTRKVSVGEEYIMCSYVIGKIAAAHDIPTNVMTVHPWFSKLCDEGLFEAYYELLKL